MSTPATEPLDYLTDEDRQVIEQMAPQRLRWSGLLAPYNRVTGDGRVITSELAVRDLPLHFRWQPSDAEGHGGAIATGRILAAGTREQVIAAGYEPTDEGPGVYGGGDMLDQTQFAGAQAEAIQNATAMMREKLGQISVDLVDVDGYYQGERLYITAGTLAGATLVGIPAFGEARVAVAEPELAAAAAGERVSTHLETLSMSFAAVPTLDTRPRLSFDGAARMYDAYAGSRVDADGETHAFTVTGSTSLPIGPSRSWDGDAARRRMVDAARREDGSVNVSQAGRGFFWRDGDGQNQGDWKLPFADWVSGELVVIPAGVSAAASFLERTDIPASAKASIRRKIDRLQARIRRDESASALMSLDDRMRTAEVDDLARRAGI